MALIRSCNDLCLTGICGRHPNSEMAAPAKQGAPNYWQFSKAHTDQRFVCGFQDSVMYVFIKKYAGSMHKSYENPRWGSTLSDHQP